jgi:uncharacterized OB-fold protein
MGLSDALHVGGTAQRTTIDHDRDLLLGGRCPNCGATAWPRRAVCQACGTAPMEELELARRGRLLAWTTVWVARPPLEAPYTLCQVQLEEGGPRIFGHLRDARDAELAVDVVVEIHAAAESDAVPPFWFEPAEKSQTPGADQ